MIIKHNGTSYQIENWEEFSFNLLDAVGQQINDEVLRAYKEQKIFFDGTWAQGIEPPKVNGDTLIIRNIAPHAAALEFGSAGRKKGVTDPYGESSGGPKPNRKPPPFKPIERWAKLKGPGKDLAGPVWMKIWNEGTEPRPLYRNVLYNKNKMAQIVRRAVKIASK